MIRLIAILSLYTTGAVADTVFAARTIPALTIISAEDLVVRDSDVPGATSNVSDIVGLETRVALYAGRPVRAGEVGPPAIVERNQIIQLVYRSSVMTIATEGRAMDRAGPGDIIRVMNLSSRHTVSAVIGPDGAAYVSQ